MKKILNLILFVCLFTNKVWGQTGNDSLVFNAYWQQVYDVVSTNTTIAQTIAPRLRTFSTQPEKYFGEISADKKRLFAANLKTFFITYIMESYSSLFKGKIKTNLKEKDTENILKFFYRETDYRGRETKAVFLHSLNGQVIDYPKYFYKESEAIYPGGEKEAIKWLSENLIYSEGEHPKGTQKITLSIDENGKAAIIYWDWSKGIRKERIQLPLSQMPDWQPAKRTDGESMPTTISLEIPVEGIKTTPFFSTEHSVESYIINNLSQHLRSILIDKELKITFTVNKDGKVSGPFDILTDTVITNFYGNRKIEVMDLPQNLKDSIKLVILNMPTWESPAMSKAGNPQSTLVTCTSFIYKEYSPSDDYISMALDDNTKKIIFEQEVPENTIEPEFPGGLDGFLKYLSKNVKYPSISQANGVQGKVIAQFIISKDGTIVDPVIIKSVDPYLDREVLRVVRTMPKWKPAMIDNTPIQVKFTLPATFRFRY